MVVGRRRAKEERGTSFPRPHESSMDGIHGQLSVQPLGMDAAFSPGRSELIGSTRRGPREHLSRKEADSTSTTTVLAHPSVSLSAPIRSWLLVPRKKTSRSK
jgi:hypothetical protein